MPIPTYEEFMHPLLELLGDGAEHRIKDLVGKLADRFALTEAERAEMLPSGQQFVVSNRVGWAKTYLKKAGLVENPQRGVIRITSEGKRALASKPSKIDNAFLSRYGTFSEFFDRSSDDEPTSDASASTVSQPSQSTPEESIESAFGLLQAALADELLDKVRSCSPKFFEELVVELLVAMGYGGSLTDAGKAIGKSGDGGIDGIIKEDKLGLDVVCIQAKRWSNTVGRPEVQAFAGSMEGFRARKGVLLTTSKFSSEAFDYVGRIERKIVLIDGRQLAQLMIEHNIGVETSRSYVVKKVNFDYFETED